MARPAESQCAGRNDSDSSLRLPIFLVTWREIASYEISHAKRKQITEDRKAGLLPPILDEKVRNAIIRPKSEDFL